MTGFIIVVICVSIAITWGLIAGKKKKTGLSEIAQKLGLQFSADRDYPAINHYAFLRPKYHHSNRYAYHMIRGTYEGSEVVIFDYHDETLSSETTERPKAGHHYASFFVLTLEHALPNLILANQPLEALAKSDAHSIDLASSPFSQQFTAWAADKAFALKLCTPPMTAYLLDHPDLYLEINENQLILGFDSPLDSETMEHHLKKLSHLQSLIAHAFFRST